VTRTTHITPVLGTLAALAAIAVLGSLLASGANGATTERKSAVAAAKPVYDGAYKRQVSAKNKRWARRVAECESGRDPNARGAGGLYRGAFQFQRSTWKSAPRSPGGDPIRFSYRTQSFVAVRLKMRDGAGHWPNCG
jgi:hypothetical protein